MNALDLLYSAAAHSGSSERGQQHSDSHAERNEHDTMRAYAVEQMRSQQETEERALSRAAAGLTIGGQAGGQTGALPTPAPLPPSAAVVWGSFERNTGTWCPYTSPISPLHLPCIPCVRGWFERNRPQSPPTPTAAPVRTRTRTRTPTRTCTRTRTRTRTCTRTPKVPLPGLGEDRGGVPARRRGCLPPGVLQRARALQSNGTAPSPDHARGGRQAS